MSHFETKRLIQHEHDYMIVDTSNVLFRAFMALNATDLTVDDITPGLLHHSLFGILFKYYSKYKPNKIIMAFDRESSWRKMYTLDQSLCVSGLRYKGNRRQNLTESEAKKFAKLFECMAMVEHTLRTVTSMICVAQDGLEADDLIAGFVQRNSHTSSIVIISGDKDMIQLISGDNVKLVDPATGKQRFPENNDVKYFIFNKCFRGDTGDNVSTAFPRLRTTKIQKAYTDPYEFTNLMEQTWTNKDGNVVKVRDVFEENQLLMDLTQQPECIRNKIDECIDEAIVHTGKFTLFHFLKFCGRLKLDTIEKRIEVYAPMLSL